jgi:hypothetical protein
MDLAIEQWHRSSPETGLATALNQLAVFKCELRHVHGHLMPRQNGGRLSAWAGPSRNEQSFGGASLMTMRIACAPAGGFPAYRRLTMVTHGTERQQQPFRQACVGPYTIAAWQL